MTNATALIVAKLNEVFAPMDAEVLAASQAWAVARMQALREFKASDEYKELSKKSARMWYDRMYSICGGKTWYNVFHGRNAAMVEEFMVKNCAAIAAKRNATITKKLEKAGVTEVVSEVFTRTTDGFNGSFVVMTDAGRKAVRVDTIRAGGYNIQCLHLRVLVHVK